MWKFPTFLPHSRFLQVRLFAVITVVIFPYIQFSCSVPLHIRSSTGSTKCVFLYKTMLALSPLTNCYSPMKKNSPLLQAHHTQSSAVWQSKDCKNITTVTSTAKVRCSPRITPPEMPSTRNHEHGRELKMLGGLNKTCTKEGHTWVPECVLSITEMILKMKYLCMSH